MHAKAIVAALAALILNDFATAQNEPPSLKILVAPVREDAIECGIDGSSIESVAALTLRKNGVQAVANGNNKDVHVVASGDSLLVISANVLRPAGNCIANLVIEIKEADFSEHERVSRFSPKAGHTWTVLCSSGTLMAVPAENASQHFYRTIESNVSGCLRQLNY